MPFFLPRMNTVYAEYLRVSIKCFDTKILKKLYKNRVNRFRKWGIDLSNYFPLVKRPLKPFDWGAWRLRFFHLFLILGYKKSEGHKRWESQCQNTTIRAVCGGALLWCKKQNATILLLCGQKEKLKTAMVFTIWYHDFVERDKRG